MALNYNNLSADTEQKIIQDRDNYVINPYSCLDSNSLRRDNTKDTGNLWRTPYVRDAEKIMHLPVYNRYADKTQVFSLYNNDDISRRILHVQLVSRIARNIGEALGLNTHLIEAISLGHDLGHTPFGHAGERFLNNLLYENTGCSFNHNVHSVRVLDKIYNRNITIQTLDGILCHNGEFEMKEYYPSDCDSFKKFDKLVHDCYTLGHDAVKSLIPSTLEGCVVRICDIIAYLGKDRQDAKIAKIIDDDNIFSSTEIGIQNAQIINNLTVDIIENSYGKNYIKMSEAAFCDLKTAKDENYKYIYNNDKANKLYTQTVEPMFKELYYKLLSDLKSHDKSSYIYRHHINDITAQTKFYSTNNYLKEDPNFIVTDYIASMTYDYFIELHRHLFPDSEHRIEYKSYFKINRRI